MKTKNQVTRVLHFFADVIARKKRQFRGLIGLRILTAVVPMITPWYYGQFVEIISTSTGVSPDTLTSLRTILFMIVGWYFLDFIAWRGIEYVIVRMETTTMKKLYTDCFDYLHRHSYRFFSENFSGALVKKVNKLVGGYETIVDMMIFDIVQVAVTLIVTVVVARTQYRVLGAGFLGWIVLYSFLQYFMHKSILKYDIEAQEQDSIVTGVLADTITNHSNIESFSSLSFENKNFDKTTGLREKLTRRSRLKKNMINAINTILMILGEFGVFGLIIHLWSEGKMDVATVVAMQLYILLLFQRIFFIGNSIKRMFKAISESAEMIEILDAEHEIQDYSDAKTLDIKSGRVELRDVYFSYNQDRNILSGLDIDISSGEKVALVGPSGAGKSTIIKVLLRLFDLQKGKVLIDGQNITDITQSSLREGISLVPQDPILFHRSLRDNIAYGKPDATMDEIIKAAEMARCHQFIASLPEGYDTFVGERGIKLSGGERQRVAIARAILEDKKILVMDEATSSLDSESEKLIQDAIHELIKNKTAIIIAHRLSTIKEMDRIIVMENGKIVEEGSHQDLLGQDEGLYQKLRNIQAS